MANVGEMLTFKFRLFNLSGVETDATVAGEVIDPKGVTTVVTFTKNSTGVYTGTFTCEKEGEHWIRVESSGGIKTAIEKSFLVAEQKVKI